MCRISLSTNVGYRFSTKVPQAWRHCLWQAEMAALALLTLAEMVEMRSWEPPSPVAEAGNGGRNGENENRRLQRKHPMHSRNPLAIKTWYFFHIVSCPKTCVGEIFVKYMGLDIQYVYIYIYNFWNKFHCVVHIPWRPLQQMASYRSLATNMVPR